MVFDLLGMSVFDFMKSNGFEPFPACHLQKMAYQLLKAVACKNAHIPLALTMVSFASDSSYPHGSKTREYTLFGDMYEDTV